MHPDDEAYFKQLLHEDRERLRNARREGDSDSIANAEAVLFEDQMEFQNARFWSDNE